jgi:glycine/D-amino acid oxidase-like deaminating enzyme
VIGAGVGGLAAAAAVSDYFEDVIVLERDELPDQIMPRAGTPQARHAHALLGGGESVADIAYTTFMSRGRLWNQFSNAACLLFSMSVYYALAIPRKMTAVPNVIAPRLTLCLS